MSGFRAFRAARSATTACAFVVLLLGVLTPGQALAAGITVSPTTPVAGDSVTATGSYTTECYSGISNNAPQITFTFEIKNSGGTYSAVSTSSAGSGVQYTAVLSPAGTYEVKEDFVCPLELRRRGTAAARTTQPGGFSRAHTHPRTLRLYRDIRIYTYSRETGPRLFDT